MRVGTSVQSPNSTIEVSVLIGGIPQELYSKYRDRSTLFVAGAAGQAYTLRVRNLVPGRVEVINTVDGRNTLKDEAGHANRNRGLVFTGYSTGEFTGWRVSSRETREFIFGSPDRSVAAQATGSAANVGVIGFASYRERESLHYHVDYMAGGYSGPPMDSAAGGSSVACASAGPGAQGVMRGLGTGIGKWQEDRVGSTSFTRAMTEAEILIIGYDTFEALTSMGITDPEEPAAFPASHRGTGYEWYAAA